MGIIINHSKQYMKYGFYKKAKPILSGGLIIQISRVNTFLRLTRKRYITYFVTILIT